MRKPGWVKYELQFCLTVLARNALDARNRIDALGTDDTPISTGDLELMSTWIRNARYTLDRIEKAICEGER